MKVEIDREEEEEVLKQSNKKRDTVLRWRVKVKPWWCSFSVLALYLAATALVWAAACQRTLTEVPSALAA